MIEFLTEDRDRSKGIYYVNYTDLDIGEANKKAKEEEGWLDSLDFWSDDEAEAEKAKELAEKELEGQKADLDYSLAATQLAEAAARLKSLQKLRKK